MASSYNKLKVADLQEECRKRGIDAKGKKAELIDRLVEDDNKKVGGAAVVDAENEEAKEDVMEVTHETSNKREREEEDVVQDTVAKGSSSTDALSATKAEVVSSPAKSVEAQKAVEENTLLIAGFQRPFKEDQAKEYVGGGLVEWRMNEPARSLAIARFADVAAADEARKRIDGIVWPKHGKPLSATLTSWESGLDAIAGEKREDKKPEKVQKIESELSKRTKPSEKPNIDVLFEKTTTLPVLYYTYKKE